MEHIVIQGLVGLVAALHIGFFYLETVAWTTLGKRLFSDLSLEYLQTTKLLASNQGVYNLCLAGGLVWSLVITVEQLTVFLLGFVVVIGIYGAYTVDKNVFFIQALPALAALGALFVLG